MDDSGSKEPTSAEMAVTDNSRDTETGIVRGTFHTRVTVRVHFLGNLFVDQLAVSCDTFLGLTPSFPGRLSPQAA